MSQKCCARLSEEDLFMQKRCEEINRQIKKEAEAFHNKIKLLLLGKVIKQTDHGLKIKGLLGVS
jgi:hypothetical protein